MVTSALSIFSSKAQDCQSFHENHCISYADGGYLPTTFSRSFSLKKGEVRNARITFQKGQDYHLNFAIDDLFASRLFIQIVDTNTRQILYDNTTDKLSLDMEFSAIYNIEAIITIETPAGTINDDKYQYTGCVGMLIENRPTPPTGFTN